MRACVPISGRLYTELSYWLHAAKEPEDQASDYMIYYVYKTLATVPIRFHSKTLVTVPVDFMEFFSPLRLMIYVLSISFKLLMGNFLQKYSTR